MPDERTVEVATVGREGVLGLSVFWGADLLPIVSIGEVPGKALKVPTKVFHEAIEKFQDLKRKLELYTQALFVLVAQGLACNTLHSIEERCARWILMTQDRVQGETLPLTPGNPRANAGCPAPDRYPGRRDVEESRTHRIQSRKRQDSQSAGTRKRDVRLLQDHQGGVRSSAGVKISPIQKTG